MKLKDCKIEKTLLVKMDNESNKVLKVYGRCHTTFWKYKDYDVVKILPIIDLLNDGSIHYMIAIEKP